MRIVTVIVLAIIAMRTPSHAEKLGDTPVHLLGSVAICVYGIALSETECARGCADLGVGGEVELTPAWRLGVQTSALLVDNDGARANLRVSGGYVAERNWSASLGIGAFTCPECRGLRDPRFLVRAQFDVHDVGWFVEVRPVLYDAWATYRPRGNEVAIEAGLIATTRYSWIAASVALSVLVLATSMP